MASADTIEIEEVFSGKGRFVFQDAIEIERLTKFHLRGVYETSVGGHVLILGGFRAGDGDSVSVIEIPAPGVSDLDFGFFGSLNLALHRGLRR